MLKKYIKDESVDLIYLDPPFNSKADYNILFKSKSDKKSASQIKAFGDTWSWGEESARYYHRLLGGADKVAEVMRGLREAIGPNDIMAYIVMMSVRLVELHRVLKATGSLYLHCDPTASHYLKIVLDAIFGPQNFKNEIVWKREASGQKGSQHKSTKFGPNHDIILFYCKNSKKALFDIPKEQLTKEELEKKFPLKDKYGMYNTSTPIFSAPSMGARPNLCYTWRGITNPHPSGWRLSKERLEEEYRKGNIEIKKGRVIRKSRLKDYKGKNMSDLWTDILPARGSESLGYPTQKPLALLERILDASSNKGDVILDPFCGCGTAIHAAQKLNRIWVGIDITHLAIGLIEYRMKKAFDAEFKIKGVPTTLESAQELANRDKFQFEAWAVTRINGIRPNQKKGKDRGIDGAGYIWIGNDRKNHPEYAKIIVSVKGGENIGSVMIRELKGTVSREKAKFGIFICIKKPTSDMIKEATSSGMYETPVGTKHPKIQIYTIKDYFDGRVPDLPQITNIWQSPTVEKARVGRQTSL